jgi:hypothetical protein
VVHSMSISSLTPLTRTAGRQTRRDAKVIRRTPYLMVMKAVTTPAAPTVLMLAEMVPYRTFRVVETLVPPPFSVRVRTSSPFSTMDGLELSTACVCVRAGQFSG